MARLEFAEGAYVRLRVPLPAEDADSGRSILTDIDVLSSDIDSRLRFCRRLIVLQMGVGGGRGAKKKGWVGGGWGIVDP
ncbi:hypothetical protein ACFWH4_07170, partial [Streptomyces sp. NPDC127091]|uniref:hypothetical protein n=1 Tax=Streptomyces sp. NPDC127091 TaxID=3347134 RepID=UPI00365A61E7